MENKLRLYLEKEQYRIAKESLIDYDEVEEKHKNILLRQICLCVDIRFIYVWLSVFENRKECIDVFNVL